jgi:hypothetical protein
MAQLKFQEQQYCDKMKSQIESIEAELDELMLEIDEWSKNNSVDLSHSDGLKLLKRFINDVDQSLSCFDDEEESELTLEFDKKWKRKVNGWLETI